MLEGGDIVIAPGVYEGFSARIAHEVGFDCIYMVCSIRQFHICVVDACI